MKEITAKQITGAINSFSKGSGKDLGRKPDARYASFDYCFNYFQSFRERKQVRLLASSENMQVSCLHLAYYLASWGMLRGSSFLLQRSVRFYSGLIEYIASLENDPVWDIDVDRYTKRNIAHLLLCKDRIRKILGENNNPSDTLLTKIMLGVFANIPAFDENFCWGFWFSGCGEDELMQIGSFYKRHKKQIDQFRIYTFDFMTGKETGRKYTKAKLIDMIGFIHGQNIKAKAAP